MNDNFLVAGQLFDPGDQQRCVANEHLGRAPAKLAVIS